MNNILKDIEDLKIDILNTKEYKEYKKYEKLLDNNSEIKSLIKEITDTQKELVKTNNIDLEYKLEDLNSKLYSNEDYSNYIEASIKLNELVSNIQKEFENYFNSLIKKNSD